MSEAAEVVSSIEVPPSYAIAELHNYKKIINKAPSNYIRILDAGRGLVELYFRRGIFSLRDSFTVRVESTGHGEVIYSFVSPRYAIEIRFRVEPLEAGSSIVRASFRGIGFNAARFSGKIRDMIQQWLSNIREELEESYRNARKARETIREEAAGKESSEDFNESNLLVDPLFEAEALLRGRVIYVDMVLVAELSDIVKRLVSLDEYNKAGSYLVKGSFRGLEASILVRGGKITGIAVRQGGSAYLSGEAVSVIQRALPAEAALTVIELPSQG
jgi:hypothetical protein